jgi:hypothetical protein
MQAGSLIGPELEPKSYIDAELRFDDGIVLVFTINLGAPKDRQLGVSRIDTDAPHRARTPKLEVITPVIQPFLHRSSSQVATSVAEFLSIGPKTIYHCCPHGPKFRWVSSIRAKLLQIRLSSSEKLDELARPGCEPREKAADSSAGPLGTFAACWRKPAIIIGGPKLHLAWCSSGENPDRSRDICSANQAP